MAQNLKYKRFTVNVPHDLAKAIIQRIPEAGLSSESSYFISLALYDLWCRRPHKLTAKLLHEPPAIRDGSMDQLAADYLAGKTGRQDAAYFERYIRELVEAELTKEVEAENQAEALANAQPPEPKPKTPRRKAQSKAGPKP